MEEAEPNNSSIFYQGDELEKLPMNTNSQPDVKANEKPLSKTLKVNKKDLTADKSRHENTKEIQLMTFQPVAIPSDPNNFNISQTPRFLNKHSKKSSDSDLGTNDLPSNPKQLQTDRKEFIKKVYILLCLQLVVTCSFVCATLLVPTLQHGIIETKPVLILCAVLIVVLICVILLNKKLAKKVPYNYLSLFLFTFLESYIISYISAFYQPFIVFCAAMIALAVAGSLTLYACYVKHDFNVCGGIVVALCTSLLIFGVLMIFFKGAFLNILVCEIGISVYSIFIVYDTQLIAGGRYEEIGFDDYVIGSVILYVDILGLFIYMLGMFIGKEK